MHYFCGVGFPDSDCLISVTMTSIPPQQCCGIYALAVIMFVRQDVGQPVGPTVGPTG